MKLGKQRGCYFDDVIELQLSPSKLELMMHEFKELASNCHDYSKQGVYRDIADILEERFSEWRLARDKKDAKRDEVRK